MFRPMKKYMKTKNMAFLDRFLGELFTKPDAFAREFLSQVFLHFSMDFTPVPTIRSSEAKRIKTPLTIFAAKNDLIFPGEKMEKRARKIFPSLKELILLKESKHVQAPKDNQLIEDWILKHN